MKIMPFKRGQRRVRKMALKRDVIDLAAIRAAHEAEREAIYQQILKLIPRAESVGLSDTAYLLKNAALIARRPAE
jgi:hypothetical protein